MKKGPESMEYEAEEPPQLEAGTRERLVKKQHAGKGLVVVVVNFGE
jgi:hypothetical protein